MSGLLPSGVVFPFGGLPGQPAGYPDSRQLGMPGLGGGVDPMADNADALAQELQYQLIVGGGARYGQPTGYMQPRGPVGPSTSMPVALPPQGMFYGRSPPPPAHIPLPGGRGGLPPPMGPRPLYNMPGPGGRGGRGLGGYNDPGRIDGGFMDMSMYQPAPYHHPLPQHHQHHQHHHPHPHAHMQHPQHQPPKQRPRRPQRGMEDNIKRTVYISYIDQTVTEEQLANVFVDCGELVDCRICGDPNSAMRFAFIEFTDVEAAKLALGKTNEIVGSTPLRVLPSKTAILPVNKELMPTNSDDVERCSRTVYIANIDKMVDKNDVRNFFEQLCGKITKLRLLGDYAHSTRISFIEFAQAESAMAALNCSGALLGSLPIRVSPSKTPVRTDTRDLSDRPVSSAVAATGGGQGGAHGTQQQQAQQQAPAPPQAADVGVPTGAAGGQAGSAGGSESFAPAAATPTVPEGFPASSAGDGNFTGSARFAVESGTAAGAQQQQAQSATFQRSQSYDERGSSGGGSYNSATLSQSVTTGSAQPLALAPDPAPADARPVA